MSVMLFDVLIVYLACGAPFAVYRATAREAETRLRLLARIASALFLWPAILFLLLADRIKLSLNGEQTRHENLEAVRIAIEATFVSNSSDPASIFEFRDAFNRYAGLEKASFESIPKAKFEVFQVVKHPNPVLASRILSRKNLKKIDRHKLLAGRELAAELARHESFESLQVIDRSFEHLSAAFSNSKSKLDKVKTA